MPLFDVLRYHPMGPMWLLGEMTPPFTYGLSETILSTSKGRQHHPRYVAIVVLFKPLIIHKTIVTIDDDDDINNNNNTTEEGPYHNVE